MKIMISRCLLGENCKYNGGNNYHAGVVSLGEKHDIIPICPEVMGGLPTPRVPAEIGSDGKVYAKDGRCVDEAFCLGASLSLDLARREQPDLCILQPRSPSCGVHQHYDGSFSGKRVPGPGVTAKLLMANGFTCIEPDEIEEYIT